MILLRHVQGTPDCSADQALTAAVANNSAAAPGRRKDQINSFSQVSKGTLSAPPYRATTCLPVMPGHRMPADIAGPPYA